MFWGEHLCEVQDYTLQCTVDPWRGEWWGRAVRRERLGGEGGTVEDVWPSRHHPTHPTNHLI